MCTTVVCEMIDSYARMVIRGVDFVWRVQHRAASCLPVLYFCTSVSVFSIIFFLSALFFSRPFCLCRHKPLNLTAMVFQATSSSRPLVSLCFYLQQPGMWKALENTLSIVSPNMFSRQHPKCNKNSHLISVPKMLLRTRLLQIRHLRTRWETPTKNIFYGFLFTFFACWNS